MISNISILSITLPSHVLLNFSLNEEKRNVAMNSLKKKNRISRWEIYKYIGESSGGTCR